MIKKRIIIFLALILIFSSFGCESFRKKFIRKPKHEPKPEEMIISPRDYSKQQLPSDELYRLYYDYWKAWHLELIEVFNATDSKKKIISCFDQTVLNLNRLKQLLNNQEKTELMDSYIEKIYSLRGEFEAKNIAMISKSRMREESRRLFRSIQRDFSFSKVEGYLR